MAGSTGDSDAGADQSSIQGQSRDDALQNNQNPGYIAKQLESKILKEVNYKENSKIYQNNI